MIEITMMNGLIIYTKKLPPEERGEVWFSVEGWEEEDLRQGEKAKTYSICVMNVCFIKNMM